MCLSFIRSGLAGAVVAAVAALALAVPAWATDPACPGGKVKLYRDPMGGPDTSPVPKRDSMNMDYIPVCEGEAGDKPGAVTIGPEKVQRLGVRSIEVGERSLARTVRAFATLQFDERKQYVVAPRYSGWIEKLLVNATGDTVGKGQPLFEAYSPELAVLQQEWRIAGRGGLAADKLRNLGYPEAELDKLKRGEIFRTVTIRSPAAGIVIQKTAVEGMRFGLGDSLFRIVDTSTMWVMAEVYEQDLAFVKTGDSARITVNAWPDRSVEGTVAFIYPMVGRDSRTAQLRIEVANPDGRLRADMTATVEIRSRVTGSRVAIPDSALIDSGQRQVVLVERGKGRYEPRAVKVGAHVPGWVQIDGGLAPGERVVTQATFLIDAESNIRAALAAFGAGDGK
jgi:Cu(I)/Ag(I) efflux system membrane fusion protein